MTLVETVDRWQRTHPALGFPLGVIYKFADDRGPYLAALITYYGFVSIFPLLLLLVAVLGFVLQGNPHLQQQIVGSAVADFPVVGTQIRGNISSFTGSGPGLAIGVVGTIYGGLGVAQAAQAAFNQIYAVPRNEQPNPIKSRLRSLLLLMALGTGVLFTTGLSAIPGALGNVDHIGPWLPWIAQLLAIAVNLVLFFTAFQLLTAYRLRLREVAVGAAIAAVAWQVLQSVGIYYTQQRLQHASEVYGVFGVVLGLLAWIYIEALVVIACAEINVVLLHHLWPRALLTPFTDMVELTEADRRLYSSYAKSQRYKGFERVRVEFGHPEDPDAYADEDASSTLRARR